MTTMIPVEPILAAGLTPLDLNNVFINRHDPAALIASAESEGLPRNICSWVKGVYAVTRLMGLKRVVIPLPGDCSNCVSLGEIFEFLGIDVYFFSYPRSKSAGELRQEIDRFSSYLGVTYSQAEAVFFDLLPLRHRLQEIDAMVYTLKSIHSRQYFDLLVSSSDFGGDPESFRKKLELVYQPENESEKKIPIGLTGVPPIMDDLLEVLENLGARVVFCEIPRQFSLGSDLTGFINAYLHYTYPYSVMNRIADIKKESRIRKLRGLVHYLQSFCHRQLEPFIMRRELKLPTLYLEGEQPGKVSPQQLMRLEAFVATLSEN